MKYQVFISHVTEERELVNALIGKVSKSFLDAIEFFVSSDYKKLSGGDEWFESLKEKIKDCNIILVFCSKYSVSKPWINFEVGAGWLSGKKIVPLCHSGMKPASLPKPFDLRHAYDITNPEGLKALYYHLAEKANLTIPNVDYEKLASEISQNQFISCLDDVLISVLSGSDSIYKDAVSMVSNAKKIIRATSFGDARKKPSEEYLKCVAKKLKESKIANMPIEYRLIASQEVSLKERFELFRKEGVDDLVTTKRIVSPWAPNVLIVDNSHMQISFIELPFDKAFRRALCFHEKQDVVENIVDWFDNYLWNNQKATMEK